MKILIISVGKKHEANVAGLIAEYEKRLSKHAILEWILIPSSDKETEGEKILKQIKAGDRVILLDEKGKEESSVGLAKIIEKEMIGGTKRLVFIIAGAYGASSELWQKADIKWSLGKLIFPHQLVRVILIEQIYRAFSIIHGEPYHHA